ncbi:MAG: prenyltransferase/squalene oxidase repeat-containing protein [Verrucomicrobiales bacterium]
MNRAEAERRSRVTALGLTTLIHLLVAAVLAWMILEPFAPGAPELEIQPISQGEPKLEFNRPTFTQTLLRKPSSRESGAFDLVVTPLPSRVSAVSLENVSESFGTGLGNDFGAGGDGLGPGGGGSFYLEPSMKGRCNQEDRARRLRENGGSPALDRKVVAALDWLQKEQNPDGSWGRTYPVAMTGFAVLAFSGHCETVDSPRYGETLIKAINYLVDASRTGQGMMVSKPGTHSPYEHGIATYALAEAYSLNKNARAKVKRISNALRNSVPVIVEGQTKGGGWLYSYGQAGTGDLSISGWSIQALKAAKLSGIRFAGIDRALEKALEYLKVAATPDGLYRYRIRDDQPGRLSLTGVGVLCGRMLGETMANEELSLAAILAYQPKQFRSADLYALYYHSQACFQKGGKTWAKYNGSQQKLVIDSQEKDGSWPVAAGHVGAVQADAKIYHTCLCTLMLEVYYRYLPATDTRS